MLKRKNKFRIGQRVQLASDPAHTFVIDRSMIPERIFREKGTNSWWTKNDLQRMGAPENPATSLRLNGKGNACGMRANACGTVLTAAVPKSQAPERPCLECGAPFQPTRKWQRFDRPACRFAYWRRVKPSRAEVPHRGLLVIAAGAD